MWCLFCLNRLCPRHRRQLPGASGTACGRPRRHRRGVEASTARPAACSGVVAGPTAAPSGWVAGQLQHGLRRRGAYCSADTEAFVRMPWSTIVFPLAIISTVDRGPTNSSESTNLRSGEMPSAAGGRRHRGCFHRDRHDLGGDAGVARRSGGSARHMAFAMGQRGWG